MEMLEKEGPIAEYCSNNSSIRKIIGNRKNIGEKIVRIDGERTERFPPDTSVP